MTLPHLNRRFSRQSRGGTVVPDATKVLVVAQPAAAAAFAKDVNRRRYVIRTAGSGAEALNGHRDVDLIVLGLELPDIDGLEVCRSIRAEGGTAIIAWAGQGDELERILALKAGADDCITAACGWREFVARVEAVMRRVRARPAVPETISLPPLRLDRVTRDVRLRDQGIDVTSKEFDLLYTLAANAGKVVSRRELMTTVWGDQWATTSRTIDTHVSSLRAKLGCGQWIVTVRGVGYQFGRGCDEPAATADGVASRRSSG
ncbi:response regulator transcription factor [Actinoplanes cyaneus]|uniref:response regulator transcription factor n=1 Tax=Actinoplanes cyaneus TaxID=52696 RepID=UPI002227AC4E|nr:response regulator transcription factor [Actinoplanes cyaneus]